MQKLILIAAVLALAGCDAIKKPGPQGADLSKNLVPGCYTVDLFDPYRLEYPEAGVPDEHHAFLGVWKQGAWNGEWCHDLYVTEVRADGSAVVLDAYGPYARQNAEATVFRRNAKIEGNELVVAGGTAVSRYRLSGNYLTGNRRDLFGKYQITLARADGLSRVPVPQPKPARLASR